MRAIGGNPFSHCAHLPMECASAMCDGAQGSQQDSENISAGLKHFYRQY